MIVRRRATASPGWPRLLRHELAHVEQWSRLGVARFAAWYAFGYLVLRIRGWPHWAAYRRLPLEVEAEWLARGVAAPLVRWFPPR